MEIVQSWDIGPLGFVQYACCIDQDLTGVIGRSTRRKVSDLHMPFALSLFPFRKCHFMLGLTIFAQAIFGLKTFKVPTDLGARGVHRGPVWLGLKSICIIVGWIVARNTQALLSKVVEWTSETSYPGYLFSNQVPATPSFFS